MGLYLFSLSDRDPAVDAIAFVLVLNCHPAIALTTAIPHVLPISFGLLRLCLYPASQPTLTDRMVSYLNYAADTHLCSTRWIVRCAPSVKGKTNALRKSLDRTSLSVLLLGKSFCIRWTVPPFLLFFSLVFC